MRSWMAELVAYEGKMRRHYSQDWLMLLFDIAGMILDMHTMVLYILQAYDRHHPTRLFGHLTLAESPCIRIKWTNSSASLPIPAKTRWDILAWYEKYRWSKAAIFE